MLAFVVVTLARCPPIEVSGPIGGGGGFGGGFGGAGGEEASSVARECSAGCNCQEVRRPKKIIKQKQRNDGLATGS